MRIKDVRRVSRPPMKSGFRTLFRFNLEAVEGLLIYDCTLVQSPNGRMFVYGPASKTDAQLLSMAPAMRSEIIEMTLREVGYDERENAAA